MDIYKQSIEEFKALNIQEKKEELLKLLYKFENTDDIFVKLINAVKTKNYSEEILLWIYEVLVKSMEKIEKEDLEAGINHLKELYQTLEKIHKLEEQDRIQEWNPDERLKQVLVNME
jgi:hypothetical protein